MHCAAIANESVVSTVLLPDVAMVPLRVVLSLSLIAFAAGTDVQPCSEKRNLDLKDAVHLSPCKSIPCRLRKGTTQHIQINFTPDHDINVLKNRVLANVFGIQLPFIGVDGVSICDKIFTSSGEKASCPLKAGENYTYIDSFPVLKVYPSLSVDVSWSLLSEKENVICFSVPARIV